MKKMLQGLINWIYLVRHVSLDQLELISQERDTLLDQTFKLAKKYEAAEKGRREIARDYAIEMKESAQNQLQMDIFQQALTNTFSEEQIKAFDDNADKLRKEHEKNSN